MVPEEVADDNAMLAPLFSPNAANAVDANIAPSDRLVPSTFSSSVGNKPIPSAMDATNDTIAVPKNLRSKIRSGFSLSFDQYGYSVAAAAPTMLPMITTVSVVKISPAAVNLFFDDLLPRYLS